MKMSNNVVSLLLPTYIKKEKVYANTPTQKIEEIPPMSPLIIVKNIYSAASELFLINVAVGPLSCLSQIYQPNGYFLNKNFISNFATQPAIRKKNQPHEFKT